MTDVRSTLIDATQRLSASGIESARTDAELLLCHVLGVSRTHLLTMSDVTREQRMKFEGLLSKRMSRHPLQHLTGIAPFRYLELEIGPGALVPRPETEIVVEAAIRYLRTLPLGARVLDLCSGAAPIAIAIATEVPGSVVIGIEKFAEAQQWARRNLAKYAERIAEVGSSLELVDGDVTDAALFAQFAESIDVVISNPPYIPDGMVPRDPEVALHDPKPALFGGADGLQVIRPLLDGAATVLKPGGMLVVEHADAQGDAAGDAGVPAVVRAHAAFVDVADHQDLTGRPRYTTAVRRGES